jgi:hypothetical protein
MPFRCPQTSTATRKIIRELTLTPLERRVHIIRHATEIAIKARNQVCVHVRDRLAGSYAVLQRNVECFRVVCALNHGADALYALEEVGDFVWFQVGEARDVAFGDYQDV